MQKDVEQKQIQKNYVVNDILEAWQHEKLIKDIQAINQGKQNHIFGIEPQKCKKQQMKDMCEHMTEKQKMLWAIEDGLN